MGQGAALQHAYALLAATFGELEAQPALADACVGHHANDAAFSLGGALEAALEQRQLGVASEEVGQAALVREALAGRAAPQAGEQEDFQWR